MATQVYRCPEHGEFEVRLPVGAPVSMKALCPAPLGLTTVLCMKVSEWVPQAPGIVFGPSWGPKGGAG